jgi:hypothetical protein
MSYEFRAFRGQRKFRRPSGRLQLDMKLGELVERWAKARNPSLKTNHSVSVAVKEFVTLIGDLPIGEIRHEEMFDFRDLLALLPIGRGEQDRVLGPVGLIELYESG